jgi:hypothetical protein
VSSSHPVSARCLLRSVRSNLWTLCCATVSVVLSRCGLRFLHFRGPNIRAIWLTRLPSLSRPRTIHLFLKKGRKFPRVLF